MELRERKWKGVGWIQQADDKIQSGDGLLVQNIAMNSFTLKKSGGYH